MARHEARMAVARAFLGPGAAGGSLPQAQATRVRAAQQPAMLDNRSDQSLEVGVEDHGRRHGQQAIRDSPALVGALAGRQHSQRDGRDLRQPEWSMGESAAVHTGRHQGRDGYQQNQRDAARRQAVSSAVTGGRRRQVRFDRRVHIEIISLDTGKAKEYTRNPRIACTGFAGPCRAAAGQGRKRAPSGSRLASACRRRRGSSALHRAGRQSGDEVALEEGKQDQHRQRREQRRGHEPRELDPR